jgi:hypothetical protein
MNFWLPYNDNVLLRRTHKQKGVFGGSVAHTEARHVFIGTLSLLSHTHTKHPTALIFQPRGNQTRPSIPLSLLLTLP